MGNPHIKEAWLRPIIMPISWNRSLISCLCDWIHLFTEGWTQWWHRHAIRHSIPFHERRPLPRTGWSSRHRTWCRTPPSVVVPAAQPAPPRLAYSDDEGRSCRQWQGPARVPATSLLAPVGHQYPVALHATGNSISVQFSPDPNLTHTQKN